MSRRSHVDALAPDLAARHAQGGCEGRVSRRAGRTCRNSARYEVTSTQAPTLVVHVCGVHLRRYINAVARQREGLPAYLPGSVHPAPAGLQWRTIGS